jgi:hypothetical protein
MDTHEMSRQITIANKRFNTLQRLHISVVWFQFIPWLYDSVTKIILTHIPVAIGQQKLIRVTMSDNVI